MMRDSPFIFFHCKIINHYNLSQVKVFANLNELIKRLYAERKLLHALFQARLRFDFSYEEAGKGQRYKHLNNMLISLVISSLSR